MEKCHFREWLYGPKSHWPEEKKKKNDRIITAAPPVKCKCGVEASYGLVPSELGVGYFCGHMVDYDVVSSCFFSIVLEQQYVFLLIIISYSTLEH